MADDNLKRGDGWECISGVSSTSSVLDFSRFALQGMFDLSLFCQFAGLGVPERRNKGHSRIGTQVILHLFRRRERCVGKRNLTHVQGD
jgi:hypothetical protein